MDESIKEKVKGIIATQLGATEDEITSYLVTQELTK